MVMVEDKTLCSYRKKQRGMDGKKWWLHCRKPMTAWGRGSKVGLSSSQTSTQRALMHTLPKSYAKVVRSSELNSRNQVMAKNARGDAVSGPPWVEGNVGHSKLKDKAVESEGQRRVTHAQTCKKMSRCIKLSDQERTQGKKICPFLNKICYKYVAWSVIWFTKWIWA